MKKILYIIYTVVVIGGMLGYWMYSTNQNKDNAQKEYKEYLPAKAIIQNKYTTGLGKRSRTHYNITYQLANGQWLNLSEAPIGHGLLNSQYSIGDTIQVYYNPKSTYSVVDEYDLNTQTNAFDYRNLLGYLVCILPVSIMVIMNRKKVLQSFQKGA